MLAACSGEPSRQVASATQIECEITAQALRAELGSERPWVLVSGPIERRAWLTEHVVLQHFPDENLDEDDWRWFFVPPGTETAQRADAPSAAMARAYVRAVSPNGVVCAPVRELAAAAGALHTGAQPPATIAKDGLFELDYVTVERAVLSPDGTEALLSIGTSSGPEAGSGMLVHYRKGPDGAWRETGRLGLWIS